METALENRVPRIVLLYWIIKIASTTLGETGADMFSMTFDLGYGWTTGIFFGVFVLLLIVKLGLKGYHPAAYWSVFTATAVAGTGMSDLIDRTLGLGYALGAGILMALLLLVLGVWYAKERSISVERITTAGAELYYWIAFLVANTLGTAAGDFLADDLGLGFGHSAALITGMLVVLVLLRSFTRAPGLVLFWLAFVLTRPFGATFGDLLTKPLHEGGLNLGTIGASIFFGVVLLLAIHWETRTERARQRPSNL